MHTNPNTERPTDAAEAAGPATVGEPADAAGVGANGDGCDAEPAAPAGVLEPTPQPGHLLPEPLIITGDARHLDGIESGSVDLIVTSPPYWRKRDYGVENQIGQEATADEYVDSIISALREWRRVLRRTGSVFLNVGDTYHKRSLAGIPGKIETRALGDRWLIRNRIIWAKKRGMPEPAKNRLASRYEYIFHFAVSAD